MERYDVIIIGAGVAGPALSLFLQKAGFSSAVYEAYPPSTGIGGGLSLAPNGMTVLAALGVATEIERRGTTALTNRARSQSGRILAQWDNGGTKYSRPAVNVRRSDLAETLAARMDERGIPLHFKKRLVQIEQRSDEVVAQFEDGTEAVGAILVGADGVRSTARRLLFPDAPAPQYVGMIGLGGFTQSAAVPSLSDRERHTLNFTFGRRGFFGYGGARPGEWMWWSNIWRAREMSVDELRDLNPQHVKDELVDRYRDYHEPIADLIAHSDPPVKLNIDDIQSLPEWSRGRSILIGDASHAVSPNSGQGASIALEDAMLLAKLLRDSAGDHQAAFRRFESERRPRVERVVAEGRRRGADKENVTRFKAAVRDVILRVVLNLFAERGNDWLYRYRIDW